MMDPHVRVTLLTDALKAAASALEQAADDLTIDEENPVETVKVDELHELDVVRLSVDGLEAAAEEAAEAAEAARKVLDRVGGAKVGQSEPSKSTGEGANG